MKAQLCPVCRGSGKFQKAPCHGCRAKGWVQVPEDRPMVWPIFRLRPYRPKLPPRLYRPMPYRPMPLARFNVHRR